jgi:DNA-binding response OmpR family regulator
MNYFTKRIKPDISILIVEDDPEIRTVYCDVIQSDFPFVELYFAENGMVGTEQFKLHRPTIVITDIDMPIMGGVKMIRLIKEINPEVIIIIASGGICDVNGIDGFNAGIDCFLSKPFTLQNFCHVIDGSINKTIH